MAIALSGGTLINQTFTGATKQSVIDNIRTQLEAAGWTTVSGGGTANTLMQSAAVSAGNQMRLRMKDNGGGYSSATLSLENVEGTAAGANGTNTGYGIPLVPNGATPYRIIAHRYGAWVFVPGANNGRDFASFGLLKSPENDTSVTMAAYLCGSSWADNAGIASASWRHGPANVPDSNPNWNTIVDGVLYDNLGANNHYASPGYPNFMIATPVNMSSVGNNVRAHRTRNGDYWSVDPYLSFASTSVGEGRITGQPYNTRIVMHNLTRDQVYTFDGHDWWCVGSNVAANNFAKASLLVMVT